MFVCCKCCVLSGRGLCDELITRPEESYRLWCVVVCDLETSRMWRPWPALGRSATGKIIIIIIIIIIISFMQGICTCIPETNYVPREYSVAAILLLLFMVLVSLVSHFTPFYGVFNLRRCDSAMQNWAGEDQVRPNTKVAISTGESHINQLIFRRVYKITKRDH